LYPDPDPEPEVYKAHSIIKMWENKALLTRTSKVKEGLTIRLKTKERAIKILNVLKLSGIAFKTDM